MILRFDRPFARYRCPHDSVNILNRLYPCLDNAMAHI